MGEHNTGIQSARDFRATSGRTARDAYESMLARRREERHADYLLTLTPRH